MHPAHPLPKGRRTESTELHLIPDFPLTANSLSKNVICDAMLPIVKVSLLSEVMYWTNTIGTLKVLLCVRLVGFCKCDELSTSGSFKEM